MYRTRKEGIPCSVTGSAQPWTTRARCSADAHVVRAELLSGTGMPGDVQSDGGCVGCELVAGHAGGHAALVATADGGDQWWWLRWGELPRAVVQIDPCTAELPQGPYADDCFLPTGHPGPHSFDLRPVPPLPGDRHRVRVRRRRR